MIMKLILTIILLFSATSSCAGTYSWLPNDPTPDGYKLNFVAHDKTLTQYDCALPAIVDGRMYCTYQEPVGTHFVYCTAYKGSVESDRSKRVLHDSVSSEIVSLGSDTGEDVETIIPGTGSFIFK